MIDRDEVESIFARASGYSWDVHGKCLWSFYFADFEEAKLREVARVLEHEGSRIVGILHPTDGDGDDLRLFLHTECEEQHTVESLLARNRRYHALAIEFGIEGYDGMDVEPL